MREKINRVISGYLKKESSYLNDDFLKYSYSLLQEYSQGGKRLRPLCLMMSFDAFMGRGNIMPVAVAIELYHTHTLILDDIMDEDNFRRDKPTIYNRLKQFYLKNFSEKKSKALYQGNSSRFAASIGVMIGNITNIMARRLILNSDFSYELKNKALVKLEKADQEIYHGQILDMYMENTKATEYQYLSMIHKKTAVLFGLCLELGALFAEKNENTQNIMKTIGEKIGMSFQIQDDIIDISGKKGHEIGSDIKNNKKTLLMIKLLEKDSLKTTNVKEIIKMMHDYGIVDYCRKKSLEISNEAKVLVDKLDISLHYKKQFLGFADVLSNPR